ncbi:MAG: hypothetical protein WD003_01125 [Candidatus Paceibacterota bacterium]
MKSELASQCLIERAFQQTIETLERDIGIAQQQAHFARKNVSLEAVEKGLKRIQHWEEVERVRRAILALRKEGMTLQQLIGYTMEKAPLKTQKIKKQSVFKSGDSPW